MKTNEIVKEAVENASDMDMCKMMLHYIHDHLKEVKFDGPDVLCSLDDGKIFLISGWIKLKGAENGKEKENKKKQQPYDESLNLGVHHNSLPKAGYAKIAGQLCYPRSVVNAIYDAKTEKEIVHIMADIMADARHGIYPKEDK